MHPIIFSAGIESGVIYFNPQIFLPILTQNSTKFDFSVV